MFSPLARTCRSSEAEEIFGFWAINISLLTERSNLRDCYGPVSLQRSEMFIAKRKTKSRSVGATCLARLRGHAAPPKRKNFFEAKQPARLLRSGFAPAERNVYSQKKNKISLRRSDMFSPLARTCRSSGAEEFF